MKMTPGPTLYNHGDTEALYNQKNDPKLPLQLRYRENIAAEIELNGF